MYGCFLPAHRKWKVPVFLKSYLSVQIGPCSCFWACCAVKMFIEDTGVFACWNLNGFAWFCHRSTGKFKEIGFRNQYYRKFNGKMEAVRVCFALRRFILRFVCTKWVVLLYCPGFELNGTPFWGVMLVPCSFSISNDTISSRLPCFAALDQESIFY